VQTRAFIEPWPFVLSGRGLTEHRHLFVEVEELVGFVSPKPNTGSKAVNA
jgi:hypothetical protein